MYAYPFCFREFCDEGWLSHLLQFIGIDSVVKTRYMQSPEKDKLPGMFNCHSHFLPSFPDGRLCIGYLVMFIISVLWFPSPSRK